MFSSKHVDIHIQLTSGTNVRIDQGECSGDRVTFTKLGNIEKPATSSTRWMRSVDSDAALRIVFLQDMRCCAERQRSALLSFFVDGHDLMPYLTAVTRVGGMDPLNHAVRITCTSLSDIYAGDEIILGPVGTLTAQTPHDDAFAHRAESAVICL